MSTLTAASVRHLLRHPAQLALALVGLALGVATMMAVDVTTQSANRAFALSLAAVSGPATNEITAAGPAGLDEQLYTRLATRFAPLVFLPGIEGYVTVRHEAFELVGTDPLAAASLPGRVAAAGASLVGMRGGLSTLERWLTEPGAVVLAARTARRLGLALNDRFDVNIDGRTHRAVLIGMVHGRAGDGTLLLTGIAQAQAWLHLPGRLSRIDVWVPPGPVGARDLAQLRARLPPGAVLQSVEQHARASLAMTHAFATSLQAMSLLALLVGLFLIYSAMSFAVVQRRQTFAVLRALGATRSDIVRRVLGEAAVLGAVGAVLGLVGGVALAHGLIALVSRTINDLYFVVAVQSLTVRPLVALEAVGAGIATALVAALLPAWEASLSPALGLRRSVLESRAARTARGLGVLSLVLAVAAAGILWATDRSLAAGFLALLCLLLSVAAATPVLLEWCARWSARVLGRVSPVGRVALADLSTSLSRTGVAVAALALALAAMLGVSLMVGSFRHSLASWLAGTLRADIYVSAPGPGLSRPERRLNPRVVQALTHVPGIAHWSASRRVVVMSARGPVDLQAVSPVSETLAGIDVTRRRGPVWPAFRHGAILLAQSLAYRLRLGPGGHLVLHTASGPRAFPIAGVYLDYGSASGVLMDRAVYQRAWADRAVSALGLYLAPGAHPHRVIAALYAAAAGRQALLIDSNAQVRTQSMHIFDRTFAITRVLEWLAAGVAALGLAASLLAWELERARDLSVLRALGLEPRGAAGLILAQTVFMGLVALAAAVPAGLLAAQLLVAVINRRAFGWQIEFHLQGGALLEALVLTLAAAIVAGLYPAARCARAYVAADLREE